MTMENKVLLSRLLTISIRHLDVCCPSMQLAAAQEDAIVHLLCQFDIASLGIF